MRHAAPQQLQVGRDGLTLRLERSALSTGQPTDAGGVLVIEEALGGSTARQAFELGNVAHRRGDRSGARDRHRLPPSCRRPCWRFSAASSST